VSEKYQLSDSESSILVLSKLCSTFFVHSEQEYLKTLRRFLNVLSNVDFSRISQYGEKIVCVLALYPLASLKLKHICSSCRRWRWVPLKYFSRLYLSALVLEQDIISSYTVELLPSIAAYIFQNFDALPDSCVATFILLRVVETEILSKSTDYELQCMWIA
jgi:hypothetical protein